MHNCTVWECYVQVHITLANGYEVSNSLLGHSEGPKAILEAIWSHFHCKTAIFHRPFWHLGNAGKDLKIILGEFLEPKPHAKFFSGLALECTGTFSPLKVGDFGPFLGGRQGTSKLTNWAQIWNHASFGLPLHLWSPFLLVPSLIRPSRPIYQNWSNFTPSPLCGPTVALRPF